MARATRCHASACTGGFDWEFSIPDDLGGHHRIDAFLDGGVVASVGLVILPQVIALDLAKFVPANARKSTSRGSAGLPTTTRTPSPTTTHRSDTFAGSAPTETFALR